MKSSSKDARLSSGSTGSASGPLKSDSNKTPLVHSASSSLVNTNNEAGFNRNFRYSTSNGRDHSSVQGNSLSNSINLGNCNNSSSTPVQSGSAASARYFKNNNLVAPSGPGGYAHSNSPSPASVHSSATSSPSPFIRDVRYRASTNSSVPSGGGGGSSANSIRINGSSLGGTGNGNASQDKARYSFRTSSIDHQTPPPPPPSNQFNSNSLLRGQQQELFRQQQHQNYYDNLIGTIHPPEGSVGGGGSNPTSPMNPLAHSQTVGSLPRNRVQNQSSRFSSSSSTAAAAGQVYGQINSTSADGMANSMLGSSNYRIINSSSTSPSISSSRMSNSGRISDIDGQPIQGGGGGDQVNGFNTKISWIEIYEPRSRTKMFANLSS